MSRSTRTGRSSATAGASEEGATAVEYAIMVSAIAAVIIAVIFALGRTTTQSFCDSEAAIESRGTQTAGTC